MGCMPSQISLQDWPSESARLVARRYVRKAGNVSCYRDERGIATITKPNEDTQRVPISACLLVGPRNDANKLNLV
jgi:hypothetical protein